MVAKVLPQRSFHLFLWGLYSCNNPELAFRQIQGFVQRAKPQILSLQTSVIHSCHAPFSLFVPRPSLFFFQTVLLRIHRPFSRLTHWVIFHTLPFLYPFNNPPILPICPNLWRVFLLIISSISFFNPLSFLT